MIGIDLGSNTLRVVKIDPLTLSKIGTYEKIVKTAEGMNTTSNISKEALTRIITAINEAQHHIDFTDNIRAVTTEALRRAHNKNFILDSIAAQTGINFEIISGEEEAALTVLGVKTSIHEEQFSLFDIGGGSTEYLVYDHGIQASRSFDLGIVTFSEFPLNKRLSMIHNRTVEIASFATQFSKNIPLIATAGTPTTVAALKLGMTYTTYDASKITRTLVTIEDICQIRTILLSSSFHKRQQLVGVGREELILTGLDIFKELLTKLGYDSCIVVDEGLREGAALSLLNKH